MAIIILPIFFERVITLITLPFDKGFLNLPLEPGENINILEPPSTGFKPSGTQEEIVREALQNPISSSKLSEMVQGKKNIVIITSDHTRPVPSHITMPILIEEIKKASPEAKITLLISTGMHRPTTDVEIISKFGQGVVEQVSIVNHLSERDENMVFLGTLPSGGELWINKLAVEADFLIGEGFIEPHFFAGFSGGRKSVLPGIASRKTVLFNHNSKFIASPYARAGILDKNPIHEDMVWAAKQAKLAFILNVAINAKKEIINCVAGDPDEAHKKGCEFVHKLTAVKTIPADIVISTNGGYPLDQNLYQAVKGMTAAEASAKKDAVIIMVAYCGDGLGGDHFYHLLADYPSAQASMDKIMATPQEETPMDQWESQILARILIKHKVIMITKPEMEEKIRQMHMDFASTLDEALEKARDIKGQNASITIIPDGVGVIGVLAEQ